MSCNLCGAAAVCVKTPFGYAMACASESCKNHDPKQFWLTPQAAGKYFLEEGML